MPSGPLHFPFCMLLYKPCSQCRLRFANRPSGHTIYPGQSKQKQCRKAHGFVFFNSTSVKPAAGPLSFFVLPRLSCQRPCLFRVWGQNILSCQAPPFCFPRFALAAYMPPRLPGFFSPFKMFCLSNFPSNGLFHKKTLQCALLFPLALYVFSPLSPFLLLAVSFSLFVFASFLCSFCSVSSIIKIPPPKTSNFSNPHIPARVIFSAQKKNAHRTFFRIFYFSASFTSLKPALCAKSATEA